MAGTGYDWGSWVAMQRAASDWSADGIAQSAEESGDATSLDIIAACEVGLTCAFSDHAVTGVVIVYVCGTADGTNYEVSAGASFSFTFTPTRNATVYKRFMVDPKHFGSFIVRIANAAAADSTATMTVKYRTATIPVAS